MENCNNQIVTLELSEYDRLRRVEQEYKQITEQPESFVKIQYPHREYGDRDIDMRELKVMSGIDAVNHIKNEIEAKYKGYIDDHNKREKGLKEKEELMVKAQKALAELIDHKTKMW